MIVDRRLLPHLDWPLVAALLALALIGLATIYSVDLGSCRATRPGREFWTQVYALPVGLRRDGRLHARRLPVARAALALPLRRRWSSLLRRTCSSSASCAAARAAGSRSAGFTLQPSEFARLAVALVLAMFFGDGRAQRPSRCATSRSARPARGRAVPAHRSAAGPRHGGHPVPGLPRRDASSPACGCAGSGSGALVAGAAVAGHLEVRPAGLPDAGASRRSRPGKDPRGAGYQQIQAKITVGSGGFYGKGFRQGTQGAYGFLPVADNDFVFSVLAEEHGFLGRAGGARAVPLRDRASLDAAKLAKDRVGAFLVVGDHLRVSGFKCCTTSPCRRGWPR